MGAVGRPDFTAEVLCRLVETRARVLAHRSSEYINEASARLRRVEADLQVGGISLDCNARSRAAVFLDRDGTLNVETGGVLKEEGLQLLPGVGAALRRLRHEGYRLAILTNQSIIARGQAGEADVAAIHRRLEWELGKEGAYLDGIYVCPHHPDYGSPGERVEFKRECQCRKPATGLLERACAELNLDLGRSWVIGDQTRDIEMARRAGVRSILVETGFAGRDGQFRATPDFVASNLTAAADVILRHRNAVSV